MAPLLSRATDISSAAGRLAVVAALVIPSSVAAGPVLLPGGAAPPALCGEGFGRDVPSGWWAPQPVATTGAHTGGEQRSVAERGGGSAAERAVAARVTDRSEGGPVEVSGDQLARFEYLDGFAEPWYREDATIEGASCVRWDATASVLELRGSDHRQRVRLLYHFASPFTMKDLVGELTGEIRGTASDRVELALSPDGQAFGHAVGAFGRPQGNAFVLTTNACTEYHGRGFWVRIAADLSPDGVVRLTTFRAAGRTKPPGRPEVVLEPAGEDRLAYCDDFRSRKVLHLAEIENQPSLAWRRGCLGLEGRGGAPVRVGLRQRFLSPEPLRAVVVRVRNAADPRGCNQFGLSLDGRTLLAVQATPEGQDPFAGTTEVRLDTPSVLGDARQFYLHMVLSSQGGQPSNLVSRVEVEARTAAPTAPTTAHRASADGAPRPVTP